MGLFPAYLCARKADWVCYTRRGGACSDIAEFYILPCYRKKGLGKMLAFGVFDLFPGSWQVRQILTAAAAISFWRATICEYTNDNYTEDRIGDAHWGMMLRQRFESRTSLP